MSSSDRERCLVDELLGPLHIHFLAAEQAYADYLAGGKAFLFACSLRRINSAARELLLRRGHLLPESHRPDALALLRHYDVWLTLWDDHADRTKPALDDPFAFPNRFTYPKDSQVRLLELLEKAGTGAR